MSHESRYNAPARTWIPDTDVYNMGNLLPNPLKLTAVKRLLLLVLLPFQVATPQRVPPPPDISAVVASGKVSGGKYTNAFFRLSLNAPHAQIQLAPVVNTAQSRARLVQLLAEPTEFEETYTFAVLADLVSANAGLRSATQYVRSLRHQFEREGLITLREEFPLEISKVAFIGVILEEHTPNGRKYLRGIYTTFRFGYALSFDVEASNEVHLHDLVAALVHFGPDP